MGTLDDIDEITPDEENNIGGERYVRSKLARRARMATCSFVVGVAGGCAIIGAGLFVPGADERIENMATFLGIFFTALFGFAGAYMGLGTYELRHSIVGEGSNFSRPARRIVHRRRDVAGGEGYRSDIGSGAEGARSSGGGAVEQDARDDGRGRAFGLDPE